MEDAVERPEPLDWNMGKFGSSTHPDIDAWLRVICDISALPKSRALCYLVA